VADDKKTEKPLPLPPPALKVLRIWERHSLCYLYMGKGGKYR